MKRGDVVLVDFPFVAVTMTAIDDCLKEALGIP